MVEPNVTEYWGLTEYLKIKPIDYYTALDAFSNEAGEINKDLPRAAWYVAFKDKGENTLVENCCHLQISFRPGVCDKNGHRTGNCRHTGKN